MSDDWTPDHTDALLGTALAAVVIVVAAVIIKVVAP